MQEAGDQVSTNLHFTLPGNSTQEGVSVVYHIEDGEHVADEESHDERLDELVGMQDYGVEDIRHGFVEVHDHE